MSVYGFVLGHPKSAVALPAVRVSSRARNVANPQLGATRNRTTGRVPHGADVVGQPSAKLERAQKGVVTILQRRSKYADFITDAEMNEFEKFVKSKVLRDARALSQGPLSLQVLAARGHPYGRGAARGGGRRGGIGRLQGVRAGVSNMAVTNRQSGELSRSWDFRLERSKSGVVMELENDAPQSNYVAFGTKRMKAHGSFVTAFARNLPAINRQWAKLARRGQIRAREMGGLG